jgi:hypothetical protein
MTTDKEHLDFIYDRLMLVHLENPGMDYMFRFRRIIDNMPVGTGIGGAGGYNVPTVEESGPRRLIAELAALKYTAGTEKAPPSWGEQHEADKLRYALMGFVSNKKPDSEAAYLQGMKDGATAAVLAIVSTLEKSWIMRLAMRITPLTVLRKAAEGLPAVVDQLPLG